MRKYIFTPYEDRPYYKEPEDHAQYVLDSMSNDQLREYVLEDLTNYFRDMLHDSPTEYDSDLKNWYSDDI